MYAFLLLCECITICSSSVVDNPEYESAYGIITLSLHPTQYMPLHHDYWRYRIRISWNFGELSTRIFLSEYVWGMNKNAVNETATTHHQMQLLMQLIEEELTPQIGDDLDLNRDLNRLQSDMTRMDSFFWMFVDIFKHCVQSGLYQRQGYGMMNQLMLMLSGDLGTNIVIDRYTVVRMFAALDREPERIPILIALGLDPKWEPDC